MSGVEENLGLLKWEDRIRYSAGCRGALSVAVGGGETPLVVSRVMGDVGVTPTADIRRHGWGCEPVVWGGLRGWGEVVVP
jgi:hypothetical protein